MSPRIPVFFSVLVLPVVLGCDRAEVAASDRAELAAALSEQALLIDTLQDEGASLAAELLSLQASQADDASRLHALEAELAAIDLSYLEAAVVDNELAISTLDAEMDGLVTESWMSQQDFAAAESLDRLSLTVDSNTDAIGIITSSYLTEASLTGYATQSWVSSQGFASETELTLLEDAIATNIDALALLDVVLTDTTSDVGELESQTSDHESRLSDIEDGYATESWVGGQGYVADLADYVSIDPDSHAVIFAGANVFVQSGSGHTDDNTTGDLGDGTGVLTGLGNLVVGYDEAYDSSSSKLGSHNLILGAGHSYTSFGGLLAGYGNTISGASSLVLGGQLNEASGMYSAVLAGDGNVASAEAALLLGGSENTGSGVAAVLLGGADNVASGEYAAVLGGQRSEASGYSSTISGGYANHASSNYGAVSGGSYNTASGIGSAVSGGLRNEASHVYSTVVGGSAQASSSAYDIVN